MDGWLRTRKEAAAGQLREVFKKLAHGMLEASSKQQRVVVIPHVTLMANALNLLGTIIKPIEQSKTPPSMQVQ